MSKSKSIVIVCLVLLSCTSPDEPSPLPPIKDSYEWELDTVDYNNAGQLDFTDIFGNSAGEVYATAWCSTGGRGQLWRYIEGKWRTIEVNSKYGGPLPGTVLLISKIDGDGLRNVWFGGARIRHSPPPSVIYGFLACYDGQTFMEVDLYDGVELTALRVISDNNVYCGGLGTDLYHYNGSTVRKHPLPMGMIGELSQHPVLRVQITDIQEIDGEMLVCVFLDYDTYGYGNVLLRFDKRGGWAVERFSKDSDSGGLTGLWTSQDGTIYSGGCGIFQYQGATWTQVSFGTHNVTKPFGTTDRNIWGVGSFNNVIRLVDGVFKTVHIRLPDSKKQLDWKDGWTNEKEVFIIGEPWDARSFGIIAHGK